MGPNHTVVVELKVGDGGNWKFVTSPLEKGSSKYRWSDVDMAAVISMPELQRDKYLLRMKTLNSSRERLLGKAVLPGTRFTANMNRVVELTGALIQKDGGGEYGDYTVIGRFRPERFDDSGYLDISSVELRGLSDSCTSDCTHTLYIDELSPVTYTAIALFCP